MPDDILDAAKSDAQKAIDDAAKSTGPTPSGVGASVPPASPPPTDISAVNPATGSNVATPTPNTTDTPIPEPIPEPPTPPTPIIPTVDKPVADASQNQPLEPTPDVSNPNPSVTDEIAAKEKIVDEILETQVVAPAQSPPTQPTEMSPTKKSGGGKKGTIIAIILLLLMLPVAVYFISLQNEQLAEIRSRATEDVYDPCFEACGPGPGTGPGSAACNACRGSNPECSPFGKTECISGVSKICQNGQWFNGGGLTCTGSGNGTIDCGGASEGQSCTSGEDCHCQGGDACTSLKCEPDIRTSCGNQGRAWCDNFQQGEGKTCCVPGYVCGTGSNGGCVPGGGNGGDNPTPTPGNAPQCNLVKVYKGGVVVSDLSSLSVGDEIVIAVSGNHASKGRIRLNGSAFTEVPTLTNGEYQLSHTILAAEIVNNKITIEAEIFGTDGNWH